MLFKNDVYFQSIAISAVLFFVSLCAMESAERITGIPQVHKKLTARKVRVIDCGLFPGLVPQDVVESCIKSEFNFCDIGRMRRVSKACNNYWSLLCPLPYGCASGCSLLACRQLVVNFDWCSKALAYWAERNHENMFKHLYYDDQKVRNMNVAKMLSIERPTLQDCMDVYRGDVFNEDEKMHMRSSKLAKALCDGDKTAVQIILLHKNVGISEGLDWYSTLLRYACKFGDIEVVFKIIGGIAHINDLDNYGRAALHHAFDNQNNLFSQLLEHGADINQRDRQGETVLFYAVGPATKAADLKKVLAWKPAMNIVCDEGCTVAHVAIIAYEAYPDYDIDKIDLLLEAGIDVHFPDKYGRTFLKLVALMNGSQKKKAMKALLKKHKIKGGKNKIRWTKPAAEGGSGYKGPLRS